MCCITASSRLCNEKENSLGCRQQLADPAAVDSFDLRLERERERERER